MLLGIILLTFVQTGHAGDALELAGATTNFADLSIEQLLDVSVDKVTTASRYEQRVTQAPASVSIVTADEIQKLGYRTLADVLGGVRGFNITYDRNYHYVGARGFGRPGDYNSRVLLLVDGHRINDNIYNQASIGTEGLIDVDLIDRVEVIRGPSSSIYGESAFFGVINVVTKRGHQLNGAEASAEAGSFDTYKGRFTVGKNFANDLELLLSGTWYDSAGARRLYYAEFDDPLTNDGLARHSDDDSYQSFFGSVRWKDFTLSGGYVSREKEIPTASFGSVFNSSLEDTVDERAYVDLRFDHDFGESTHLMARVSYDRYSYYGHYPYYAEGPVINPGLIAVNQDEAIGQWVSTEWQVTQKLFDRHVLVGGVDYRENFEQTQRNFYYEPGYDNIHIDNSGRNVGLYSQVEISILTNLMFNGGLRYDHYDTFGDTLNPRLGLLYSPWQKTTFKLLYGRAFRAPNVFELYYEAPGSGKSNPDLRPEHIHTYELVYEQYLPANLRFTASGYYYQIDELISQQVDELGQIYYSNLDQAQGKGVELELEHKSVSGLRARASYAFQRTENSHTGQELSNSPRHLAKFALIVPVYRD
ncbi:MAG TPA: TonB-dependent receptor, partial [Clostridia bacterium]|nr:TonB-dependent receptor [Clostridia bacterium]